jgi:signal transduction histidine kinase
VSGDPPLPANPAAGGDPRASDPPTVPGSGPRESRTVQRDIEILVGMLAHDLRTPLSVIGGFADLLRRRGDRLDPSVWAESLDAIVRSVAQLNDLIDGVVAVARGGGGPDGAHGNVDLVGLAHEVVASVVPPERRASVQVVAAGGLPFANADRDLTWRVIANLVANAVKHSPGDAGVDVEIGPGRAGELEVRVTDRGTGIAEERLPGLFGPFAPTTPVDSEGGWGFGLYIARRLVEEQGGRIEVRSTLGLGSTFLVTLKAAPEGGQPTPPERSPGR